MPERWVVERPGEERGNNSNNAMSSLRKCDGSRWLLDRGVIQTGQQAAAFKPNGEEGESWEKKLSEAWNEVVREGKESFEQALCRKVGVEVRV